MLPAIQDNAPVMDGLRFTHDGHDYKVRGNKLYRHHEVTDALEVAVVYSPTFGGGWSTWNSNIDPTDARVALTYMAQRDKLMEEIPVYVRLVEEDPNDAYDAVVIVYKARGHTSEYSFQRNRDRGCELYLDWLPVGTLYMIDEYDGFESVVLASNQDWLTA